MVSRDGAAVPDGDDEHDQLVVLNAAEDAVIPDAVTPDAG
jgi:hypothetical protein